MRENLVLVRAGDRSLHPQWLSSDSRNWDLALSYYGDFPDRYLGQYDFLHCFKGSKWEGISDFVNNHLELIQKYKYVWLPDDDILTNEINVNNFFITCRDLDFVIAQPALTRNSYFGWEITLAQEGVVARLTDFVEIMAPCFCVEHFCLFSSYFGENTSGWGYEWLWAKIARGHNLERFGIVDCTPVFHTREVGSVGHGGSKNNPRDELKKLLAKFELQATNPRVLGVFR